MARTLYSRHWHRAQNALIQQQVDAAIAAENQPLPEQLPIYTRVVHRARVNRDFVWSRQPLLCQTQNRSGWTICEEIAHRVRLEYIREGHPATLDLWFPPRYITPPEYIRDLEHEEFLYRNIPTLLDNEEQQDETPVLQEAEQQEPIPVLQAAEPLEQIVVRIDYPRQFRRIVHRLIFIFLAILFLYVL